MNGHLINFAIDAVSVFSSLVLAIATVTRLPRNRNALLTAAILLGNACFVVLARQDYAYWIPAPYHIDVGAWEPLLNIGRNLSPGLFMLLCYSLFQERARFPAWLLAPFGLQLLLEEPIHLVLAPGAPGAHALTEWVPGTLESMFSVLAIYWTVTGWGADLVEARRRLRWILLIVIGLGMLGASLLLRVVIPWDSVYNYYTNVLFIDVSTGVIVTLLLSQLGPHDLARYLSAESVPSSGSASPGDQHDGQSAAVARLEQLMRKERVYRQPGLSLSDLARRMDMPEYRLRRLIHERLGYRNFNVFLHQHRIGEACELLRDRARSRTPILTIALSVGYQSINTFNRGFREVVGSTPSAYRAGTADADDGVATTPSPSPGNIPPQILKKHPVS